MLVAELIRRGHRTIAFCRSRKGTELIAAEVRRRLPVELAKKVRPYRGGYLAAERREIEGELFGGHLRGVIATTALELGIDVGGLDACVLNGFPGTISSMWQQAGRAGREAQESIVILVAGDDQLDQWFMAHPDQVFTRPPEPAVINPANPYVLHAHLACAAHEQPLGHVDERWWPGTLDEGVRALALDDRLKIRDRGRGSVRVPLAVWAGRGWPTPRGRPAQRLERRGPHRHRRRHPDRHRRPRSGLLAGAPGRRLPAPGPVLPGGRARPRRRGGHRRAVRRRPVDPAPVRDRHHHPRRRGRPTGRAAAPWPSDRSGWCRG